MDPTTSIGCGSSIAWKCYRCEQSVLRLARIEASVLHNNRHIRFDQARVRSIPWNCFRVVKIVESQMPGAPARDRKVVRANRITLLEKDCDRNVSLFFGSVQDAARLMARHRRGGTMAF